ncbi:MAG: hypothetical protein IPM39_29250 [Chloroflexi bacterium]|nr:hypothetical protein [Chloroflexota bacterium]
MELFRLFFAALLVLVTGTAVLVTLIGLFPRFAAQTHVALEQSPGRSFIVGLVNLFFLSVITLTLLALAENAAQFFALPALIFLGVLAAAGLLGLAGLALLLGQRLWPDKPPVTRHAYAALLLLLALLAPFVGWFLLLPLFFTAALGACVMVAIGRVQQGRMLPADEANSPT